MGTVPVRILSHDRCMVPVLQQWVQRADKMSGTAMEVSWGEWSRVETSELLQFVWICSKKSSIICVVLGEWGELEGALCFTHSGSRGGWGCSSVVNVVCAVCVMLCKWCTFCGSWVTWSLPQATPHSLCVTIICGAHHFIHQCMANLNAHERILSVVFSNWTTQALNSGRIPCHLSCMVRRNSDFWFWF